jgi:hypothetical protein
MKLILESSEFCGCLHDEPGNRSTAAIGKVREILAKRSGGASTLKNMSLEFQIMDTEHQ